MRVADLRPGWRTEFILHRHGAQVLERDDCLVVRTPGNPGFYWGNCLVLPNAPGDADVAHWLARFDEEIGQHQPASRHVAIGVDAAYGGDVMPAWQAAGFRVEVTAILRLIPAQLRAPRRPPVGRAVVRAIDPRHEAGAVIALEATDAGSFEPERYREYQQRQWVRYRAMADEGVLRWFGLWCDGTLAACCGLLREAPHAGSTGRFQRVLTHPAWRRRGLCTALIHRVATLGLADWQLGDILIAADPGDVAIAIYESLGFERQSSDWGLQKNAPEDRPDVVRSGTA